MNQVDRVAFRWMANLSKPENGIVYTGIFLDPMDAQRLIKTFGQTHSDRYSHHMTLWHYGEGGTPNLNLPWGKTVPLKVIGHVENDDVQTVLVQPPPGLRPEAHVPHITVSTASGVGPKASKDLLEEWDGQVEHGLLTLKGKVGWVDTREKVHYEPPPIPAD